jgi:hypothetical protein
MAEIDQEKLKESGQTGTDGSQKPNDAAAIPCVKAGSNNATAVAQPHWPILYAILRPALFSGNEAVRHHMERLAEVLQGEQLTAVRELLDRQHPTEPPPRVVHGAYEDSYGTESRMQLPG